MTYAKQRTFTEGLSTIKTLTKLSTLGESVEGAQFLAGTIYLDQGNLLGARNQFRFFMDNYPGSSYARNAEYLLSEVEKRLGSNSQ